MKYKWHPDYDCTSQWSDQLCLDKILQFLCDLDLPYPYQGLQFSDPATAEEREWLYEISIANALLCLGELEQHGEKHGEKISAMLEDADPELIATIKAKLP